ncbi:hypothetical protein HJ526_02300 [Donghicola sp. C2-DW-16]|uniref:Uncharacterized protein n=1 Tax=Donghicola mangrovi TaxID=2729614 RepID=A0ABX2PAQ4_9RHOB|nr:hypothetical protein [Donghicola mangrovi]NVO26240.1 hypothetical protein [Donghicola mangrovi]
MALPLAATVLLRYGAVALAAYAAARRLPEATRSQPLEDALDHLPEGMTFREDIANGERHITGRFRRVVRFGNTNKGFEIDGTLIGRLKVRKLWQ